jgi:hypothetical protein
LIRRSAMGMPIRPAPIHPIFWFFPFVGMSYLPCHGHVLARRSKGLFARQLCIS